MDYFLCIETSTEVCSVAIGNNEEGLLTTSDYARENSHSETITLQIEDCMQELGLSYAELSAIGISRGPGSYTGLRVGTSVAKGICYAWDIPLIAVDSLYGIAAGTQAHASPGYILMPMIDARRMEVYTAVYDSELNIRKDVHNLILEEGALSGIDAGYVILCGNGAVKSEGIDLGVETKILPTPCSASYMIDKCIELYYMNKFEDVAYFSPFYFKSPNITKSKKNIL